LASGIKDELDTLLTFLRGSFTGASQYDSSPFMQGGTPEAKVIKEIYTEVSALKSREASSENVLRVAKETLDARKRQIRTLTVSLKQLQNSPSLAGMGLSGSMDSASTNASADSEAPRKALEEAQSREQRAMEVAASSRRKLERAMQEVVNLREEASTLKAELRSARRSAQEAEAPQEGDAGGAAAAQEEIGALRDKIRFLEEDHRQRSERITEVSERLTLKRKEEREMIDALRREVAQKDANIRSLQQESGATSLI